MRRIKKVRPMEVSLCNAAANRRVFGLYKSQNKPEGNPLEDIEKGGPGSGPHKGDGAGGASSKAQEASAKADKSGNHDDHRAAASAHGHAAMVSKFQGDKSAEAHHLKEEARHNGVTGGAPSRGKLAKGGPGSGPHKGDGSSKSGDKGKSAVHPDGSVEHNASADTMTNVAAEWTNEAKTLGDSDTHGDAASAHRDAEGAQKAAGNHAAAEYHRDRAAQHTAKAEKLRKLGKNAGASRREGTMSIQDAISNTDPQILKALGAVAKSVGSQDGRSYTPQAASIIKAVGRLLAPFAEELTLGDLQAVGKAAGLGATAGGDDSEAAPAFKSVAKPGDDEDELEDDADTQGPDGDDVADDEEVEAEEDEDEEETEEEAAKSARTIAAGGELSQGISKSKAEDESEEDADEEDDDEDDEDSSGSSKAPPFGQPKGAKAKGGKVAKAAHAGQSVDARIDELMLKHRQLAEENKVLREGLNKSRTDLDAERDFRQLEAIKKSIREDYGHLGLDEAKFAPVLKKAQDADDQAHYQQLTSLLKSCNDKVRGAQAAGGIFEAVGKSAPGSTGASWADRIEARVDEEMKKSAPGANRAVVYDQFIQTPEGREMRKNHRLEKGRI